MYIWLAIWGVFAALVIGFVGWTMAVLFQQKKAWSSFARKNKLNYMPGKMMESPAVNGLIKERTFVIYSGIQQTDDIRGQRYVTIIEFQMGKGMATGAAIATKDYLGFINGLIFTKTFKPDLPEWKDDYVVRTRDPKNLALYLNKERQQVLAGLFTMKNAAVLLFFDEIEAVLRIETSDPLRDEKHLERIVQRLSAAVEKLAPTSQEKKIAKRLLAEEKKRIEEGDDEDEVDIDAGDLDTADEDVPEKDADQTSEAAERDPADEAAEVQAAENPTPPAGDPVKPKAKKSPAKKSK